MNRLPIHTSEVFTKIRDSKKRNIVLEGGARSSKTYSVLQYFIVDAFESKIKKEYDIVRETLPALKATALKDFIDIMKSLGLYHEENHNMSENIYSFRGHHFNFYSTDDEKKLRGRKRHKILLNEPNDMPFDVYKAVDIRTTEQIIMDYNPSQEEHWIYDHIIPKKNCEFILSTYKDNPFIEQEIIDSIEAYKDDDPDYWKIFGLGQRGKRQGLIYQNWDIVPDFPSNCSDILYGLDFGFNDPKVVVKLGRLGHDIWIDELLYQQGIVREEFIPKLQELIPYDQRTKEQYADSADPESIEVICRAGFNIHPADKSKDSVLFGIETVKGYRLHITARSVNVIKDFKNYKWKVDKNGKTLDEPIHAFSHAPDAVRYPVYTHWGKEYRNVTLNDMKNVDIQELESIGAARNW
jgi:phage terminase large subunit